MNPSAIKLLSSLLLLIAVVTANAQLDFSTGEGLDDLSDEQLQLLLGRASNLGYSEQDIYSLAEGQGYSAAEILQLRQRIEELGVGGDAGLDLRKSTVEPVKGPLPDSLRVEQVPFFGYNLFNPNTRGGISFEPNLFIPATDDYVLGPADEISVSVYGASEKTELAEVNASGFLTLENVGPIFVSGLTLKEAKETISGRLSQYYSDLRSRSPRTFVDISIYRIRTISVSLVGEVRTPGTYSLNGLTTAFNALYIGGGPNVGGTLREIKVIRDGKTVAVVDYYDFLMHGKTDSNVRLRDDDIILVGSHLGRVSVGGEVKRPAVYEVKDGETVQDLLNYAGGFSSNAYRDRVSLRRMTATEKSVADVYASQFELFEVKDGDDISVGEILDRYANRVTIKGSVFRPGQYAIEEGLTLSKLLERAEGLKGDAFTERALVTRTKPDLSTEIISVALADLLNTGQGDIALQREDVVQILSIYDLEEETFVQVSGEVNRPGAYKYSTNMTVRDLIFMANGFRESAATGNVEISSRPENQSRNNLAEIQVLDIDESLTLSQQDQVVVLRPFDHVFVRRNPNFFEEKTVQITGQVKFPGKYAIVSDGERISNIIERAGGLLNSAYVPGANLIRETEYFRIENDALLRQEFLLATLESMDTLNLSEADEKFIEEAYEELEVMGRLPEEENVGLASTAKRERLLELAERNPLLGGLELKETESIALNLAQILRNPGSDEDFFLENGDIINIPKELKTIRLRGKVLYPNTVRFEDGRGLKYFIGKAGGFDTRAKKSKTYVVYANGDVSRTNSFLFMRSYPKPQPGSEVIVPSKPPKIPLKPGEIVGLTSGLATLGLIVTQIIQISQ